MKVEKFNPYNHFGFLTNRIGRLISNSIGPMLKELGYDMPHSCMGVMAELWVTDGLNQKELGFSNIKNKSSVNKMVKHLMDAGLIIKKLDQEDRRNNRIFLTEKGKQLKEHLTMIGIQIEKESLSDHTEEEIAITKKVLTTLYQKLLENN